VSARFPARRPYTADAVAPPQPKTRHRLRALAAAVPAALAGTLVLAPAASAGWFLPESGGSPNADAIRTLYILIALVALVIFIAVEGLLIYSLVKYRARKGAVAAQIHGNTQLEIGWTVGAAVILIFITAFTFALLDDIKNPAASDIDSRGNPVAANALYASTDQPAPPAGSASMNIVVDGQQYVWRFQYPGEDSVFSYTDMVVPVGMTITLDITADDVIHSWWIPQLGGKMDAVPGYTNKSWFKIPLDAIPEGQDRVVYEGQCAELCGRNHANMIARVRVLSPSDFEAWLEQKRQQIEASNDAAAEQRKRVDAGENP
jgi:cytochrome c oxidase subunit II